MFTSSLILKSYSKINVSLRVLGKREDAYHLLEMVNLPLELHDIIEISKFPHAEDTFITCDDIGLQNARHNLCSKAVDAMRKEFGFKDNFSISIHKEIPFAAGLGGGSSNAATVILAINRLLNLRAPLERLSKVGRTVGADVPFFLYDKPAKVTGIGESLEPILVKKVYNCLIVKPQKGLSTTDVFSVADRFDRTKIDTANVIKALETGNDELLGQNIGNDLYEPAVSLLPEVKEVVDSLREGGFAISNMSGSGSACFALSDNIKKLKAKAKEYEAKGYIVRLTRTIV
ncbi:MAG: 4-(cytidine 5'-diphospho)-2-C-methyl-D-erythritol kinase [Bacilli bacterium]|jgi:4-diphosphocytidyl-2-C-methyl-D-erythritol kinase|nr:4-(cytidine 5'-diphospho)-2-C-methyl-D-erythritol kinase [Bacilli bacterium]